MIAAHSRTSHTSGTSASSASSVRLAMSSSSPTDSSVTHASRIEAARASESVDAVLCSTESA